MKIKHSILEDILSNSIPDSVKSIGAIIELSCKEILERGIAKLDLVTREEFDLQKAILLKTRKKVEEIENKINEIKINKKEL